MGMLPVNNFWQPLDDNGAILAGGSLEFYKTGTSTPKSVYTDKALTTGAATSLTLDGAGRAAAFYGLEDEAYRIILKDSAGATIWTEDEIYLTSPALDELTRRKALMISPIDYGCVGDGATDDSTNFQLAINAAAGGTLNLEGKTYRIDSGLTVASEMRIINGVVDGSNCDDDNLFTIGSTAGGGSTTLTADGTEGDTALTVDSESGFASGDAFRIDETSSLGEWGIVKSTSANTINLEGSLFAGYTSANGVTVNEFSLKEYVVFEKLRIIGNSGASGAGRILRFENAFRCRVRDVALITSKGSALQLIESYDIVVDSCVVRDTGSASAIEIDGSIDCIITNTHIQNSAGIYIGSQATSTAKCYRTRVVGGSMQDVTYGVRVDNSEYTQIIGIDVRDATTAGILIEDADDTKVIGGILSRCVDDGVQIAPGTSVDRIDLIGLTVEATNNCVDGNGTINGIRIIGGTYKLLNDVLDNIDLDGDSGSNLSQVTIGFVHLINGVYGISVANNATSYHGGCTFEGQATGQATGTFATFISS